MLFSLDIETECAVESCEDNSCKHALIPHQSRITCIGLWRPGWQYVLRNDDGTTAGQKLIETLNYYTGGYSLLGQNLKFDLKKLAYDGITIPLEHWGGDSQIAAHVCLDKVTPEYLAWYGVERKKRNKELPRGYSHRDAGSLSLKTLAPFFLGVEPFWEDPTNHDNDGYVLKDCEYAYRLHEKLLGLLEEQGLTSFYQNKMMPWARMLLDTELRGITLDMDLLAKKEEEAQGEAARLKQLLDQAWEKPYLQYFEEQKQNLASHYAQKRNAAIEKLKKPYSASKIESVHHRYDNLYSSAVDKIPRGMNIDSPAQLLWILRDCYKLDVENFQEEESTGKAVLQKLAAQGREDIKLLLQYREQKKLCTSFFPTYRELADNGILRCNFNITGTRTGRLSSSSPNLQQVPGDLHKLFIARPGYKLITRDASYIEPRLIAYYSEDAMLCDIALNDKNFHSENAKTMFSLECDGEAVKDLYPAERGVAKTSVLANIYGAMWGRIQIIGLQAGYNWPAQYCKQLYENLKEKYHEAFSFKELIDEIAINEPITNFFGRQHRYDDPADIYMKAFNTLIQSTASDLILDSAHKAKEHFKTGIDCSLLLLVHDEQVWECREDQVETAERVIEMYMTDYLLPTRYGNIPLKVEGKTSDRWEK